MTPAAARGRIFSPDDYGEQFFVKLNDDKKFVHYKKHPALAAIPQFPAQLTFGAGGWKVMLLPRNRIRLACGVGGDAVSRFN